jgi:vacuolar-type H+-ATPase subunit F/Vma7
MAQEHDRKIGFIGDKTSIEFFRLFGAAIFPAGSIEEAGKILKSINFADYGVIFITEEVFDRELFAEHLMDKKLLPIPSLISASGKGHRIVEELIRKATGMKEEN